MRTQEELVKRYKERKKSDVFGFEVSEYVKFMEYEFVKSYLKKEITKEQWNKMKGNQENIRQIMIGYIPFAWEKANNCRGISAERSINHYQAWLWVEGEWSDEEIEKLGNYQYYGKNELRKICKHLGLDPDQWDDRVRQNSELE